MKKVSLEEKNVALNGLPWYKHNGNRFWRLPYEIEDSISHDLWEGSKHTSGARIRFCSDTSMLGLTLYYENVGGMDDTGNMCKIGRMGIDLYVDGLYRGFSLPKMDGEKEEVFFSSETRKYRQFTIYLPLYHHIEVKKILLDDDAVILPPEPFAVPKPVAYYGTSITQGGCASRSGLSYQAILSRELNIDYVNLGFSGLGRGEKQLAEAMVEIDASCYVLDYALNNKSLKEFDRVYGPFFACLREKRPETPVIFITPIPYLEELWNDDFRAFNESKRDIIRNIFNKAADSGDKNVYLLEGKKFLSLINGEGQVDGGHPNDLGLYMMSSNLKPLIMKVLNL